MKYLRKFNESKDISPETPTGKVLELHQEFDHLVNSIRGLEDEGNYTYSQELDSILEQYNVLEGENHYSQEFYEKIIPELQKLYDKAFNESNN